MVCSTTVAILAVESLIDCPGKAIANCEFGGKHDGQCSHALRLAVVVCVPILGVRSIIPLKRVVGGIIGEVLLYRHWNLANADGLVIGCV